jgi:hypothetical protein
MAAASAMQAARVRLRPTMVRLYGGSGTFHQAACDPTVAG